MVVLKLRKCGKCDPFESFCNADRGLVRSKPKDMKMGSLRVVGVLDREQRLLCATF
ncbi:hypothetical protein SIAM614_08324 [Stappia aggregata IAM 12614]|uniref:Uncharacterized protein n=1 Tax=Roseibium aggregatum (strain ATCC 25650 / DSM 13394 / JCM 20685 / NBRC 16684 / NCIMB 2208 / IAM 12614 / B1) TaxID=384765 RepID=A0P228_ROSAI|nr:hypothetical protein SIAM614_08324 [Stappia aggregata IAM 12614] [Roseibium aggregatum IAM 12614]